MNRKSVGLCLGIALLACLPLSAQTYTFQDVNFPGDTFTQFLGINTANIVAGYHGAATTASNPNKGFTYNVATKTFTDENFPASDMTQVTGINHSGMTVGFYVTGGVTHGFTDTAGKFVAIDQPGTPFNQLLSQSDNGQASGYFSPDPNNALPDHAYVYDETGKVFATYLIPNSAGGAQATGVNNAGVVCGFTIDSKGVNHGWLLMLGTFRVLNFPGSTGTQALGLNNNNQVVGFYTDKAKNSHGFIYNIVTNKWVSVDDPNGVGTTIVSGINNNGTLVGFWGTSPLNTAFIATPKTD